MAYPSVAGHPQYSGNFIPEIWAGKLIENFYDATVLAAISNTDYEGSIRQMGDTVNIRTTPELTIRPYVRGQTLQVEHPDKPKLQLLIDKGDYFSAVEDDIDKTQSDINLMDAWTKDASERMKITIDTKVLPAIVSEVHGKNMGNNAGRISNNIKLGSETVAGNNATINSVAITQANVLDLIIDMGTVLDEANCPEENRFMVIPAKMCGYIKQSDLKDASISGDSVSPLRNGRMGMIDRFMIYKSHLLKYDDSTITGTNAGTYREFQIIAGHKMGFTFASQLTNMETIRAESTFGNIIRGLQVYGYQTVKPEALARAVVHIPDRSS